MFDSVYGPLYPRGVALMTRMQRAIKFIVVHAHLHTPCFLLWLRLFHFPFAGSLVMIGC